MTEEFNEEYGGMFCKKSAKELEKYGLIYVFNKEQVEEIRKLVPDVVVKENECGYTLTLPRVDVKEE